MFLLVLHNVVLSQDDRQRLLSCLFTEIALGRNMILHL